MSGGGIPPAPPPTEIGDSPSDERSDEENEVVLSHGGASSPGSDRRLTPTEHTAADIKKMQEALLEVERDKYKFGLQRAAMEILRLNEKIKQLTEETETLKTKINELSQQNQTLLQNNKELEQENNASHQ
jgi:TolA-binding protein